MEIETIENILNFLKEKEGKEIPKKWELIKELENHLDGTQYWHKTDLYLDNSTITKLPNDLYVGGHLNLVNCKQLTKLPDELYVDGYFSLHGCEQITKLPDDLHVSQSLIMIGTNIEEIPNNLYVGWNLFIFNTPLAKKYKDGEIYEMIRLRGGKITNDIVR